MGKSGVNDGTFSIVSNSDSEGDVRVVQGDDNAPVRRATKSMKLERCGGWGWRERFGKGSLGKGERLTV